MTSIALSELTVSRDEQRLLGQLDLTIASGERLVVLGPSGSGKTTLLRAIAGLETVSSGRIHLGDRDVTATPPRDRHVALVDQRASLQPHLSVEENLSFALRLRHTPREEVQQRVEAETRAFSLRSLLPRRPRTLSAGERHEVAVARSLVRRASVLLMDEPLARIDPVRRSDVVRELVRMQEGYDITLVVATNDQRVAMTLAHRIAVLDGGVLAQIGPPAELYAEPATTFVAGFLGSPPMNLLDGIVTRTDGRATVRAEPFSQTTWDTDVSRRVGEPVVLGVRPEHLQLHPRSQGPNERLRVVHREFMGAQVMLHLRAPTGRKLIAMVDPPGPELDRSVWPVVDPHRLHLFDPLSGRRIATGI